MARRRRWSFQSACPFFGLTSEYRTQVFNQIHEIVYHGNGGYDWWTVYSMPIWLRNFTYRKIADYVNKQSKDDTDAGEETVKNIQEAQNTVKVPDYISKVSNK